MFLGISVAALSLCTAGCGGNVTGSGGGGSGTGGSAGTTGSGAGNTGGSTGGALPAGDCQSAADCGGNPCVEVTPGGFKVCTSAPPPEASQCTPNNPVPDECCTTADCMGKGTCYLSTDLPYCGGPAMAQYNRCVADQCAKDADCGGGQNEVCAPAGIFGNPERACTVAYCTTNADCNAKTGGYCAPINDPCCSLPSGLGCVYPGGCRSNEDCAADGSQHCEIDGATKSGVCKDGPAACPV
jgi:hypothetical protein